MFKKICIEVFKEVNKILSELRMSVRKKVNVKKVTTFNEFYSASTRLLIRSH